MVIFDQFFRSLFMSKNSCSDDVWVGLSLLSWFINKGVQTLQNCLKCFRGNRIVGDFLEGFVSLFLWVKSHLWNREVCEVKTAKFWLSTCKANEPHFSPSYSIYIATKRSVSVSVPLMANTVAIQEIKVLCKHRHVRLSTVSMNALVWGHFPRHSRTRSWFCHLSL